MDHPAKPPRRWLRFTVREWLVAVCIFGVAVAWWQDDRRLTEMRQIEAAMSAFKGNANANHKQNPWKMHAIAPPID